MDEDRANEDYVLEGDSRAEAGTAKPAPAPPGQEKATKEELQRLESRLTAAVKKLDALLAPTIAKANKIEELERRVEEIPAHRWLWRAVGFVGMLAIIIGTAALVGSNRGLRPDALDAVASKADLEPMRQEAEKLRAEIAALARERGALVDAQKLEQKVAEAEGRLKGLIPPKASLVHPDDIKGLLRLSKALTEDRLNKLIAEPKDDGLKLDERIKAALKAELDAFQKKADEKFDGFKKKFDAAGKMREDEHKAELAAQAAKLNEEAKKTRQELDALKTPPSLEVTFVVSHAPEFDANKVLPELKPLFEAKDRPTQQKLGLYLAEGRNLVTLVKVGEPSDDQAFARQNPPPSGGIDTPGAVGADLQKSLPRPEKSVPRHAIFVTGNDSSPPEPDEWKEFARVDVVFLLDKNELPRKAAEWQRFVQRKGGHCFQSESVAALAPTFQRLKSESFRTPEKQP